MAAAPKQASAVTGWRRVARPSGRRSRTREPAGHVLCAGRWWEGGKSRWTVNAGGTTGRDTPCPTSPCRKKAERAGRSGGGESSGAARRVAEERTSRGACGGQGCRRRSERWRQDCLHLVLVTTELPGSAAKARRSPTATKVAETRPEHNDTAAGEPGARHGACRSKVDSSTARHGKRRDGRRRVAAKRAQRAEPPGRVFCALRSGSPARFLDCRLKGVALEMHLASRTVDTSE